MGRIPLREGGVSKLDGHSDGSCGTGGAGVLHGEPVTELLDAPVELASDGGAVEEERAGDGEDASRVLAADGRLDVRHVAAIRWVEAVADSEVPERRTVCSAAWLNQQRVP